MSHDYITHRCEGSLANRMSIRWHPKAPWWALIRHEPDFDSDYYRYYGETLATIDYCPWCGKRLDVPIEDERYDEWQRRLRVELAEWKERNWQG